MFQNGKTYSRREFMKLAALASLGAALPFRCFADEGYGFESLPPLREIAAKKGIYYGLAFEFGLFQLDPRYKGVIERECNLLVPENSLKWRNIQPTPDKDDYANGDKILAFAEKNKMKMRGHTLVYPSSLPDWVKQAVENEPKKVRGIMEAHIHETVGRYRNKIISWDVVNEAIEPQDGLDHGLRTSPLIKAMGPEYIDIAFRAAAEADPKVQLVYNDFGIEPHPERASAVLSLLRRMQDRGTPIHAVGLQSHISSRKKFEPLSQFCKDVKAMGLEILVTELDVFETVPAESLEERDRIVADRTRELLETVCAVSIPKQIVTWSISDRHSFISTLPNRFIKTRRVNRGLPFDTDFLRKPMWKVLYDVIAQIKA